MSQKWMEMRLACLPNTITHILYFQKMTMRLVCLQSSANKITHSLQIYIKKWSQSACEVHWTTLRTSCESKMRTFGLQRSVNSYTLPVLNNGQMRSVDLWRSAYAPALSRKSTEMKSVTCKAKLYAITHNLQIKNRQSWSQSACDTQ